MSAAAVGGLWLIVHTVRSLGFSRVFLVVRGVDLWDAYQTSFAIRVLEEPVLPYLPIHSAHLNLSPASLHSTPHPDSFLIYLTLFNYDFTPPKSHPCH